MLGAIAGRAKSRSPSMSTVSRLTSVNRTSIGSRTVGGAAHRGGVETAVDLDARSREIAFGAACRDLRLVLDQQHACARSASVRSLHDSSPHLPRRTASLADHIGNAPTSTMVRGCDLQPIVLIPVR